MKKWIFLSLAVVFLMMMFTATASATQRASPVVMNVITISGIGESLCIAAPIFGETKLIAEINLQAVRAGYAEVVAVNVPVTKHDYFIVNYIGIITATNTNKLTVNYGGLVMKFPSTILSAAVFPYTLSPIGHLRV